MRIVKAKYEILTPISEGGIEELKHIEAVARTCYKSEDKITPNGESAKKMVKNLISAGHEAMIEHSTLCVKFIVDRGVSHEIVRHRIASYAQESTRYCNYTKEKFGGELSVIDIADGILLDPKMANLDIDTAGDVANVWVDAMESAEKSYNKLIAMGVSPQMARSVLPNSTKTEVIMTANYREWRNFFKLRTSPAAHPQIREVAIPLLKELQSRLPIIFDDIEIER